MPTRFGNILKGAFGGGVTGASLGGGHPLAIGAGALIGAVTGGIEKTDEERMQDRMDRFLAKLREKKEKTLREGRELIGQATATEAALATERAARGAAARGTTADVEAFALPAQQAAYSRGSRALKEFALDVSRAYDMPEIEAELGFATRELPTSAADYLLAIGEGVTNLKQTQQLIDILGSTGQIPRVSSQPPTLKNYKAPSTLSFDVLPYLRSKTRPRIVPLNKQLAVFSDLTTGGIF